MRNLGASNYETARDHLRKVMIAAAVFCVLGVAIPAAYGLFKLAAMVITVILFIVMVYIICTECRCPHCGKIIFLGALAATYCPCCKRSLMTGKKQKKSR